MLHLLDGAIQQASGRSAPENSTSTSEAVKLLLQRARDAACEKPCNTTLERSSLLYPYVHKCDESLHNFCCNVKDDACNEVSQAYEWPTFDASVRMCVLLQTVLRYWLMHDLSNVFEDAKRSVALHPQSLADLEYHALSVISETNTAHAPFSSWAEAALSTYTGMSNNMSAQSKGCFIASATILLCRASIDSPFEEHAKLRRSLLAARLDWVAQSIMFNKIVSLHSRSVCADSEIWAEKLFEWTARMVKFPMPDALYQLSMEFFLMSRYVPSAWGAILPEGAVDSRSCTFRRNPASSVLAHVAPDRAAEIRKKVCDTITRVGVAHTKLSDKEERLHLNSVWEMAIVALHYACMQECDLIWMGKFFIDDEMNAMKSLSRFNKFRSATNMKHAPAVVHSRQRWYLKFLDDSIEVAHERDGSLLPAWHTLGSWCHHVYARLDGVPCRGKNIHNVLNDIANS
ncbi:hypothetical protein CYMTET_44673 [Cymbomonas tetramitiformis]|uniref:Uncharacterized protein n=1 Tax=Cymbomonas tetramitiformis TaxID=36881 RepID=A0AAE0BZX1_9CHLO|nr:hypothetical protein CYMTET_44673 [Cymbomonas tetramitiformis]